MKSTDPDSSRSLERAMELLEPIAEAFARAHARGVCTPPQASRSSHGAPEQRSMAYGIPGPWTDVFNLAIVFVELLRAFGVEPPAEVAAVVARALEVYPAERWQTAGSFWRALRDATWIASGKRSLVQPCPTSSASATSSVRASTTSARTSPSCAGPTSSSTR